MGKPQDPSRDPSHPYYAPMLDAPDDRTTARMDASARRARDAKQTQWVQEKTRAGTSRLAAWVGANTTQRAALEKNWSEQDGRKHREAKKAEEDDAALR
ncbi:MAG TPA: hypothetical protein VIY73_05490, partial [Polyangiaceae bacterium]